MDDLIARLESATEGSRDLDGEIARLEGWTLQKMKGDARPYWREPGVTVYYLRQVKGPPRYTSSLDAALTLVPEGLEELCREMTWHSDGQCNFSLCYGPTEPFNRRVAEAWAATPALAICIAALRARQHNSRIR